jgi:hypothetical protein
MRPGAVTSDELQALAGEKHRYSLWLTTAAQHSGAYLSDVQVKIMDSGRNVVLETAAIGPWLFVDLPAGAYQVEATFENHTERRNVRVGLNHPEQLIVYFEADAALSPEWRSPFTQSPYAAR